MAGLAIPRVVIGGVASGVGKTTATIGLCRALRARGLQVAVFKCGPDYLDPTYHQRAAGRPSHNLDGWLMGRDAVRETFVRGVRGADLAVIEGVMGLFDGVSPTGAEGNAGSTAEIARWLEAPVLLVADASGMARSFAALAAGFAGFDPDLRLAGLIANRVGSRGHLQLLRQAQPAPPILGGLPEEEAHAFPGRHLGLRTADAEVAPDSRLDAWGALVEAWWNVDAVLALAGAAPPLALGRAGGKAVQGEEAGPGSPGATAASDAGDAQIRGAPSSRSSSRRPRIGVAFDQAFHFYYEHNLAQLAAAGAELVRFSPLHDPHLPEVDGVYLGGGYPEVHAAALAANATMKADLIAFAGRGRPIYAECGGLMYLAGSIRTLDGTVHPMVGLLPGQAVLSPRLEALGYVEVETQEATILGPPGLRFRGHQFRYSRLEGAAEAAHAYRVRRRRGGETFVEGYRSDSVLGSYVHAHWASNPLIPRHLARSCA